MFLTFIEIILIFAIGGAYFKFKQNAIAEEYYEADGFSIPKSQFNELVATVPNSPEFIICDIDNSNCIKIRRTK